MKGNRKISDRKYFLEILLFIWHFRGVHREEIKNEKILAIISETRSNAMYKLQ